jgi:hypothetical protein
MFSICLKLQLYHHPFAPASTQLYLALAQSELSHHPKLSPFGPPACPSSAAFPSMLP